MAQEQAEVGYQYLGEVYYTLGLNKMTVFKMDKNVQISVMQMEVYHNSIAILGEGTAKYPENAEMIGTKFSAYIGANKMQDALSSAEDLVEKDPPNKFNRYNYGVVLLNTDKFPEAETQLLEAIKIDPEYDNAIYNLGVTYVKWGTAMNKEAEQKGVMSDEYKKKYEAALPYLEKVVEKDQTKYCPMSHLGTDCHGRYLRGSSAGGTAQHLSRHACNRRR